MTISQVLFSIFREIFWIFFVYIPQMLALRLSLVAVIYCLTTYNAKLSKSDPIFAGTGGHYLLEISSHLDYIFPLTPGRVSG